MEDYNFFDEVISIKKHFVHFRRTPEIIYIPDVEKYNKLQEIIGIFDIKIITEENDLINYLEIHESKERQ